MVIQLARAQGTPLPPLLLDAIRCVPFQFTPSEEHLRNFAEFAETTRQLGEHDLAQRRQHGLDEDRVLGEYTPGSEIPDPEDTFATRFLYAFWRLCEQRIARAAASHESWHEPREMRVWFEARVEAVGVVLVLVEGVEPSLGRLTSGRPQVRNLPPTPKSFQVIRRCLQPARRRHPDVRPIQPPTAQSTVVLTVGRPG